MRILHVKGSNLAWAPDAIAEATNTWTEHHAEVWKLYDDEKSDLCEFRNDSRDGRYDIVHFHNKPRMMTRLPSLIHYHSEPGPRVDLTYQGPKYVVAQYQMTLPEYADCKPMRNVINFIDNPVYDPYTPPGPKLRVGFSPSILEAQNQWYDKGAAQTIEILERLVSKYPDRFEFDLIHGVPLEECLQRKRRCHIIIDECVTGSYHRSGLEGLAMGKKTICGHFDVAFDMMVSAVAHSYSPLPFSHASIDDLEAYLEQVVGMGILHLFSGKRRRQWMEQNWHPRDIALEWVAEYERVLNG